MKKALCYDPAFKYVRQADMKPDHLQRLFARIRKQQKEEAEQRLSSKVTQIIGRKAK